MAREAYSWTVLRAVPCVARGERLNVGVALHSRRHRFLGLAWELDVQRLRALDPALDVDTLREHLEGLQRVADGDPLGGRIAGMDAADRFGFLAAPSSTIVQPSPVHTGVCDDPETMLSDLFARTVAVRRAPR